MKHYGDITKISGAAAPPVNVIIGGSPCQDLSVAGKQKGIKHTDNGDAETTRSGLFMEQLRIIKEMRRSDIEHGRTGIYTRPRFMVWENVPRSIQLKQRRRLWRSPRRNGQSRVRKSPRCSYP